MMSERRHKSPSNTHSNSNGPSAVNRSLNTSSSSVKKPPLRPSTINTTNLSSSNRENNHNVGKITALMIPTDSGYLSDVRSEQSNLPSEVSEDFYSSTKMLEQHFRDKYKYLKEIYEQRVLQLSEVINHTCEQFLTDEVLIEMRSDKASSSFIPSHLGEIIHKHLEHDREAFVHKLVAQMSSMKVELLQCQEAVLQRNKTIASMESDVIRGRKMEAAHESSSKRLTDTKRQLDELMIRYEDDTNSLKQLVNECTTKEKNTRDELFQIKMALTSKETEYMALRVAHEDKTKQTFLLENSFDQAVEKGIHGRLQPVTTERDSLSNEANELKIKVRFLSEELTRTQEQLQLKLKDEESQNKQFASIMSQVETMLAQEAAESNATVLACTEKMNTIKDRLTLELQQERRLSTLVREELSIVRRDRDEKTREARLATDELQTLREKLSLEIQKTSTLSLQLQETQSTASGYKSSLSETETKLKLLQEQFRQIDAIKDHEVQLLEMKARVTAFRALDDERISMVEQFDQKTEALHRQQEKQFKSMMQHHHPSMYSNFENNGNHNNSNHHSSPHHQLRHSYTFGDGNRYSDNYSTNNSTNNVSDNGGYGLSSVGVGGRTMGGRSLGSASMVVPPPPGNLDFERAKMESEFLIAKAKYESKMVTEHQEIVQTLQDKLRQACGSIERLKSMAIRAKTLDSELSVQIQKNETLETQHHQLKESQELFKSTIQSLESQIHTLEENHRNQIIQLEDEKRQLEMKWDQLNVTSKQQMEALRATWAIEKQQWQSERMTLEGAGTMANRTYEQELRLFEERFASEKQTLQREYADMLTQHDKDSEKEKETLELRWQEVVKERDQYAQLLETTKRQALEDHARDTEALAEMNRKFDALMLVYESNKSSSLSAEGNKFLDDHHQLNQTDNNSQHDMILSNSSMEPVKSLVKSPGKTPVKTPVKTDHSHEMITAQQVTIQSLEQSLQQKSEDFAELEQKMQLAMLQKDEERRQSELVSSQNTEIVRKLKGILSEIRQRYSAEILDLRQGLHALRDAVSAVEPAVALEMRRIIHAVDVQVHKIHDQQQVKQEQQLQQELQRVRVTMTESHAEEMEILEHAYLAQFNAQGTKSQERENLLREELSRVRAEMVIASTASSQAASSSRLAGSQPLSSSLLPHPQASPPRAIVASLSTIPSPESIAHTHASSLAHSIGTGGLGGRSLGGSSQGSNLSQAVLTAAVAELENAKEDNSLLLELANMEYEAKIQALQTRLEDVIHQKDREVELSRVEMTELEAFIRRELAEDLTKLRNQLDGEQQHRQVLEQQRLEEEKKMTEKNQLHVKVVEGLEFRAASLQKRAEKAELEVTKMKMELLHERVNEPIVMPTTSTSATSMNATKQAPSSATAVTTPSKTAGISSSKSTAISPTVTSATSGPSPTSDKKSSAPRK